MKNTFYSAPESISDGTVQFGEDEAHHAVRVLRVRTGDEAVVVDGKGNSYAVTLKVVGRKSLIGSVKDMRVGVGEPVYDLTVAVGMLKNIARFETFVEKAVELGVRRIVPLITKRSEKARLKARRIDAILISAMKQSGRSRLTEVQDPVKLRKWLKDLPPAAGSLRAICHEGAPTDQSLAAILEGASSVDPLLVAVGPEGGFEDEELGYAAAAGFRIVSLGPRRLRTETAAMVSAATVMTRFLRDHG